VTDQPGAEEPSAARARHRLPRADQPEKSFLALIPRRDLSKIVLLLVVLVVVVALQRRSGSIVQSLTRGLYGPVPARQAPKEPPRVRLAPPAP
jgi:hypothetical protein